LKKNILSLGVSTILLSVSALTSVSAAEIDKDDVHNRCIIQLKDNIIDSDVKGIAKAFSVRANANIVHTYTNSIKGFTIKMPCFAAHTAFGDSKYIKSMESDAIVTAIGKPTDRPTKPPKETEPVPDIEEPSTQKVSYGTTRVGGSVDGTGKTAWVIDSGVDLDHPDLNVDTSRGFTVFRTMNDENGHGTHVAGIIGAIDNTIDTVGIASNTTIIPVRVMDRKGNGFMSDVIAGIDHVASYDNIAAQCVNLSLGGGVYDVLDTAIIAAAEKTGAYFTLAAGNESDDAINHSPARANGLNVFTISAVDENDAFAWFSNYGESTIDYAAPGVQIVSLWKNGGTNTIDGTSMAAPHACAVLMMTSGEPAVDGTVFNDPDDTSDLIIHLK